MAASDGTGKLEMGDNLRVGANQELEDIGAPRFYLILSHIAKKHNVGTMLRSASAFGVREVLVAGSRKSVQFFGSQGTHKHVAVRFFDDLDAAVSYAKGKGCKICGVEIKPEAKSVLEEPFDSSTAFLLGNEGDGLNPKQSAVCDTFVYIPHYGDGTASLNVSIAASIVFHRFAAWAKYPERAREGEKFVVKDVPRKTGANEFDDVLVQEQRLQNKAAVEASSLEAAGGIGAMFAD